MVPAIIALIGTVIAATATVLRGATTTLNTTHNYTCYYRTQYHLG